MPKAKRIALHAALVAGLLAGSAGAALACSHDIQCPDKWVWSDKEGTCVEADEQGTT